MANSKNITFDQLQNALTRVKSALDGKANASHGNHVPKTETANNAKFLRNDNTWQTVTPVNIGAADRSHTHGSYANQNAFSNVKVGSTTVAADSPTDTLTLTAGANVTITPDATNDNVTIAAKDTVYTHPTSSGNKHIPSGGSSGQILRWSADGTAAWGSDNNTDTKVTNTLNTTAKAYVTGTTSATTNTGTQIFDTGVYLDTTAGKLVASTFSGALSGNASSATKLQNARNFKIGNTSRSFNGTADVTWTLSDIGAAAASHNHTSLTGVTKLQFATESSDSAIMKVTTEEANTCLDFEMNDDVNTDMYRWRFSAYDTNGATPYFNLMTLTAKDTSSARLTVNGDVTASSFTGNASSATKLQTARSINGTNFDGSGNITTANWGTSRTLTIGNTGKSVNGSGNVSWTLDEIGAAAKSHGNHVPATQTADNKKFLRNDNTWQTVTPANIGAAASNHSHSNYAASSHGHNYLDVKGTNTINSTANDTTAKWGAQGNSVHWYTEAGKLNGQPSQWGYLVNIGQSSEVHQIWMTQSSGDLLHRGGNGSGWSGSWRTILDSENYSTWAAAKSHSHNYAGSSSAGGNANAAVKLATARTLTIGNTGKNFDGSGNVSWSLSEIGAAASNHTHNYAASNHNHDSAYLKLSGGTLSGQLTVNNNVQAQGFCVSKNSKEVWLDIGDNDTYIWASGANKSLQITHDGTLNFDGQPVLYGGRGNNYDTATSTIYFNNAGVSHKGRISCYNNSDGDYVQLALRTADATTNYLTVRTDTVNFGSPIIVQGHKLTIDSSAPSNPDTGDVWINIG